VVAKKSSAGKRSLSNKRLTNNQFKLRFDDMLLSSLAIYQQLKRQSRNARQFLEKSDRGAL
jgi:hypothetical protein